MRVVFMGSPDFAIPSLQALAGQFEVAGVITQPDRPAGRGRQLTPPPVKLEAAALSLPVYQPRSIKDRSTLDQLSDWGPAVIVVAAYGQILPAAVLDLPDHGCLNIHASLLPRWRGAAPVQAAILHDDDRTGVTLMRMDEGLDTGPLIAQRSTEIGDAETGGRLEARLAVMGAELLVKALPAYVAGQIEPEPQDDAQATYAPMLRKSDGALDFRQPAGRLSRMVRAFDPWPGTFFHWRQRRIVVLEASATQIDHVRPPGTGGSLEGEPAVHCSRGLLVLHRVQPAGKRPMTGRAFLHGAQEFADDRMDLPENDEA